MILWLASYPKSGNTIIRAILSAFFFSKDGNFSFKLLNNISQFPNANNFLKIGVDYNNKKEVIKNYVSAQKSYLKKNNITFLKTHSLFKFQNKFEFTNLDISLGAIYIVRDPRNVVLSYSHFFDRNTNFSTDMLLDKNNFLFKKNTAPITYIGSWQSNFNSWKALKERCLIIKYEDLILQKEEQIIKIIKFIEKLSKKHINEKFKIIIELKKLKNIIKSTSFEAMKNLELQEGFQENPNQIHNKKFFNLGAKNKWQEKLDFINKAKIESSFEKEMKELGYL